MKCVLPPTHWAKSANQGAPGIWVGFAKGHPIGTYQVFNPKTKKIILTKDVTFLQKSFREYSMFEKPLLITMSYEGLNDDGELKMVPVINNNNYDNNNNYNVVSDFESDMRMKLKQCLRPLSMPKWCMG